MSRIARVVSKLRDFAAELRRSERAVKCYKQARRLYSERDWQPCIAALREALQLIGTPDIERPVTPGVARSTRLNAITLLACAEAERGNRPLALSAIGEARAIIAELRLMNHGKKWDGLDEWTQWADRYASK
jgi:hypothetical protein